MNASRRSSDVVIWRKGDSRSRVDDGSGFRARSLGRSGVESLAFL